MTHPADNDYTMFNFLVASLIWGTVGVGYLVYGKKQAAAVPIIGGLTLIVLSYVISSALTLSLASLAVIAAMHGLIRRGF